MLSRAKKTTGEKRGEIREFFWPSLFCFPHIFERNLKKKTCSTIYLSQNNSVKDPSVLIRVRKDCFGLF